MLLCAIAISAQANGFRQDIGDKTILHVWGNHYERGYAHGYYMAPEVLDVMQNYFFQSFCFGSSGVYNTLYAHFTTAFDPDQKYETEAQGLLDGVASAGQSIYFQPLGRNLNYSDVLMANAIVDLSQVRNSFGSGEEFPLGCASLSSWGAATQADSLLNGSGVITRLLDWNRDNSLIQNPILIVHHPSEPDERKWISFTYPGLIGALSAISNTQNYASLNMGNVHGGTNYTNLHPILLSIRNGLEMNDYDQNGDQDTFDVFAAIQAKTHRAGTIVHTLWQQGTAVQSAAIENNNGATVYRTTENSYLPSGHLLATNHFRQLTSPVCCLRYQNVSDSLYLNANISAKRQWQVLTGAAGDYNNLMAIQYTPSTGNIVWTVTTDVLPAFLAPALGLNTSELFSFVPLAASDQVSNHLPAITMYPNPLPRGSQLRLKSDTPISSIAVYNLRGQLLQTYIPEGRNQETALLFNPPNQPNGIYFLHIKLQDGQNHTKRFLLLNNP